MPVTEQVMIEFVPDTQGLDSAIEQLTKAGLLSQEEADNYAKNNKQFAERSKSLETMADMQDKLATNTRKSEQSLEALSKSAKGLTDNLLNEGSLKFFDKLAEKLKNDSKAMQDFKDGALDGMLSELENAGVSVEEFTAKLLELEKGEGGVEEKSKSLKAQLKELKVSMAEMKLAGNDNTEAYEQLRMKAGEMTDAIGDVNQEVARSGSDTSGLDKLISTSTAVVGGFQVMQGAMALVAGENKDLQESFVRLQAGMSLLQGLQAIGNELAREDSLIKQGLAVANTITAATQQALGIATVETSFAFKALRLAIIATGIGALIVAIGLLIANWDYLKQKGQELIDKFGVLKTVFNFLEESIRSLGSALGVMDSADTKKLKDGLEDSAKAAEGLKNNLDGQAEMLEAIGGKSQRILDIRKQSLKAEEDMLSKKLELAKLNNDEEKITQLTNDLHKNKIAQLRLEDDVMKLQVEAMRNQGKSEKEILEFQKQRILARINELEVIIKQAEAIKLMEGGFLDQLRDGFVGTVNDQIEALKNKMGIIQTDYQNDIKESTKKVKEHIEQMKIKVPTEPAMSKDMMQKAIDYFTKRFALLPPVKINAELAIESTNQALDGGMTSRQKETQASLDNSLRLGYITNQEWIDKTAALKDENDKREIQAEKEKQQKLIDIRQAAYQSIMQLASILIQDAKDRNKEELDSALSTINSERDAMEQLHNDKKINDVEYAKEKKILDKQEADAKMRAWERDKQLTIREIELKTLQAIITAFASSGPPASFILAGAAGVFGALQLQKAASAKPPKFAKGTMNAPSGWKWVGEEGPELINTPGGEQIKTHEESMKFATMFHRMDALSQVSNMKVNSNGQLVESNIELKKIFGVMTDVKSELKNLKVERNHFDRRGYTKSIEEGGKVTYDLGAKY